MFYEYSQCLLIGTIKQQLQSRAVKTLMGLGKHFRQADTSGDGMLDQGELKEALRTYHLQLSDEVIHTALALKRPRGFPT